eukprot:Sdes_comp20593_c0_seq1m15575
MPFYLPLKKHISRYMLVDAPHPELDPHQARPELALLETIYHPENDTRRFTLQASGPDHMTFYFDFSQQAIKSWSIAELIPPNKDFCFVFFASGNPSTRYEFWVEVKGRQPFSMAFAAHYFNVSTPLLEHISDKKPNWLASIGWVSYWGHYTFI